MINRLSDNVIEKNENNSIIVTVPYDYCINFCGLSYYNLYNIKGL